MKGQGNIITLLLCGTSLVWASGCSFVERQLLFHPTHRTTAVAGLSPWIINGELIGYAHIVRSPSNVWLMLHGNGGQASDRSSVRSRFSPEDSVYILEYPGYGVRKGTPSRGAFDAAAREAYEWLRAQHPNVSVCVAGESLGSGPASYLAGLAPPPDKIVLIVPFDKLSLAAEEHFPAFLVKLLLKNDWDNVQALSEYRGPIEIFAAMKDGTIPIRRAQALATAVPSAKLVTLSGGHRDWASQEQLRIRNP